VVTTLDPHTEVIGENTMVIDLVIVEAMFSLVALNAPGA
jgi:hypothetical protein